jgi:chromosomal replication initiator protein
LLDHQDRAPRSTPLKDVFIPPTLITDLAVQSRNDAIEKVNWHAMPRRIEGIDDRTVHLTVPTKFLKGCIQVHYADGLLACSKGEHLASKLRPVRPSCGWSSKPQTARFARISAQGIRSCAISRMDDELSAPATATKREVIAGSPRDALLTFNTFKIGESTPLRRAADRGEC